MMMIFFSQRLEIERRFKKWCEENHAAEKPVNLIAFMECNGWLNEEKIVADIPYESLRSEYFTKSLEE